jgi:acyl-CoA reductase-like NAD-dependent aldehyde dehydrogenase
MATSRTAQLASAASGVLAKLAGDQAPNTVAEAPASETTTVATAEVPKATAELLRRAYRKAERRKQDASEALEAAKADIIAAMGPAEVLAVAETGKVIAEHKTVNSLIFDQTRFRSEHPDQVAGYMRSQTSRRFRMVT